MGAGYMDHYLRSLRSQHCRSNNSGKHRRGNKPEKILEPGGKANLPAAAKSTYRMANVTKAIPIMIPYTRIRNKSYRRERIQYSTPNLFPIPALVLSINSTVYYK
jgi:hypothetical protein